MIERRRKASSSEFKEIWPGLKRCMVCGFTLATENSTEKITSGKDAGKPLYKKEDSLHSTYHGKFFKAKTTYGVSNVLDYKVLKEKEENLPQNLLKIKEYDISDAVANIPNICNDILDITDEVSKWVETFKDSRNNTVNVAAKRIEKDIAEVRDIIGNMDKKSVESYHESLYKLLPTYRNLFDGVISAMELRVTGGSDLVPLPNFSFNTNDRVVYIENLIQVIPNKQTKVDAILKDIYTVEYTKSLRLWDMCKVHPAFDDYVILLWSTKKFRDYIRPYMTDAQFNYYVEKYKGNRQLVDYNFKEAPFYFGRVELSEICDGHKNIAKKAKKKALTCNGNCAKCKFGIKDLSYTDGLAGLSDEDDSDAEILEDMPEYDDMADYDAMSESLMAMGKLFNK